MSAVGAALDVQLSGSATALFWMDASCTQPATAIQIPGTDTSVGVYATVTVAGPAQLTAEVGPVMAPYPLTVAAADPADLQWLSPPQTLRVSQCSKAAVLTVVDAYGNSAVPPGGFGPVQVTAFTSLRLYADDACANPLLLLQWPAQQSSLAFYFRADEAGSGNMMANAAGFLATQTLDTTPAVRSGTCSFLGLPREVSCPIPAPVVADLNRTWLVFQATSGNDAPFDSMVSCALDSTSTIRCSRAGPGTTVTITWSVVEFSPPVFVQHLQATCTGSTSMVALPASVDPAHTFVTLSAESDDSSLRGGNLITAELADANNVALRMSGTFCSWTQADVQVVEHPGANVLQGEIAFGGNTTSVPLGGQDPSRTFVLYSWRMDGNNLDGCEAMLRGSVTPDSLVFERGLGRGSCGSTPIEGLVYQRVEMIDGSLVIPNDAPFGNGELTTSVDTNGAEPALTTAFTGGMFNGMAGGEGRRLSSGNQQEMLVNLTLTAAGVVDVTRATSTDPARFSVFAVQWAFP